MSFQVAIDGPAGAGKSTIARKVASRLGFQYVDTGSMYRAVTLKALNLKIDLEQDDQYSFLDETSIVLKGEKIFLDTKNVTDQIRSIEVTNNVSTVSKIAYVRKKLVEIQRKISKNHNVVMDGRDIGTVVLVGAELKIFLSASSIERARRRMIERTNAGIHQTLEEIQAEIEARDLKDSTREISPLRKADDAVEIDTSFMSIDEVVDAVISLVEERGYKVMENPIKYTEGQLVTGVISQVKRDAIYVNLDESTRAAIYRNDLEGMDESTPLNSKYTEGQEFSAIVKTIDTKKEEPVYILSTKMIKLRENFATIEALVESAELVEVNVFKALEAGLLANYGEYVVFIPAREVDLRRTSLKELQGETIQVVITKADIEKLRINASHSLAMQRIIKAEKEEAIGELTVGDVVVGKVKNISDFGCFIDLGKVDGLLHISEISHKNITSISDVITVGQEVKVKIIRIKDGRVGLSLKALQPHPWDAFVEAIKVDDVVSAKVEKMLEFGLILEVMPDVTGLMPRSEYSWVMGDSYDAKIKVGDMIDVKVMNIDSKLKRISLSHRQIKLNPWANVNLRMGDSIKVTVTKCEERGAIVRYNDIEGYLPIAEISQTRRLNKADEGVSVGQELEVKVKQIDPARARLQVSLKANEIAKERSEYDAYNKAQQKELPATTFGDLIRKKQNNK